MRQARPKAAYCGFDDAMDLTLEELAERLDPARYADLPGEAQSDQGEMALFEAALIKLVESQSRAVNVRRIFYLAVTAKVVNKTEREAERVQGQCWLRREGRIPYDAIVDEARNVVVPPMWATSATSSTASSRSSAPIRGQAPRRWCWCSPRRWA